MHNFNEFIKLHIFIWICANAGKKREIAQSFGWEYLTQIYRHKKLDIVGILNFVFDFAFIYREHKESAQVFRHRTTLSMTNVEELLCIAIHVYDTVAGVVE
jgi:hypothetical protein